MCDNANFCIRSSVGRASVSEAEGRWFDPSRVRQDWGLPSASVCRRQI